MSAPEQGEAMTQAQNQTDATLDPTRIVKVKVATATRVLEWSMTYDDGREFLAAMHVHIKTYGFRGWRREQGVLINVECINAVWMEEQGNP